MSYDDNFNSNENYDKRGLRMSESGDFVDRTYNRDVDYRRDRQRRETRDCEDWESRRENSYKWSPGCDRYDDLKHKNQPQDLSHWNESSDYDHSPSRDDHDGEKKSQEGDDMSTIFVGGLPTFIAEPDIEDNLRSFGLRARDIRVIKKRDPGSNRGFAFVEFYSVSEAQDWMDLTKGVLNFCEGISTTLSYSLSRSGGGRDERLLRKLDSPPRRVNDVPPTVYKGDWKCVKCGCINFRRRDRCFKCKIERQESDYEITSQDGSDFLGLVPTETLLIRGLGSITDETRIRQVLFYATKVTMKDVFIARNPIDHSSAGFGFVLVESSNDSLAVMDALRGSGHPLEIDGCTVQVNFSKMNFLNVMVLLSHRGFLAKSLSSQEESANQKQEENQKQQHTSTPSYNVESKDEKQTMAESKNITLVPPDTSRYVFDDTSGYYYDPATDLYYDAASQYFYDNKKGCFLYWDERSRKYVEVSHSSQSTSDETQIKKEIKSENSNSSNNDKEKKAKQAKKIAQEMERWAKNQNLNKEGSFKKPLPVFSGGTFVRPTAPDAGFKILAKSEKKIDIKLGKEEKSNVLSKLVASYGDSDSDDESSLNPAKELESLEEKLTDWKKLRCLLCKRVFTSLDVLKKHRMLSDLHKTNLEKYKEKLTGKVTAVQ